VKRVYIIAEAGVNHNGDINIAKRLVDTAKEAGADIVKFQTFLADNLASKYAQKAEYQLHTTNKKEFGENTVLVTYHPVTLENQSSAEQFYNLLKVLESRTELHIIFTKTNSDTDGRIINRMIDAFVAKNNDRSIVYTSLGQTRYLSVLKYVSMVIGNSSSGIIEVPSFHIPTVDIGDRQRGRIASDSVVHCKTDAEGINHAFSKAMQKYFRESIKNIKNPYEGKSTSAEIVDIIKQYLQNGIDLKKKFYDLDIG
jgi:GDP/UDP-N,N'-diacetylbacillosamine 2-epimerase (hydrolysing)